MARYADRPIASPEELDELLSLRATLNYADWTSHPRFKREPVLRAAQRQWGVREDLALVGQLPLAVDVEARDE